MKFVLFDIYRNRLKHGDTLNYDGSYSEIKMYGFILTRFLNGKMFIKIDVGGRVDGKNYKRRRAGERAVGRTGVNMSFAANNSATV